MEVFCDGLIFELQSRGGISRIFSEMLPRLCDLRATLDVTLMAGERLKQDLPVHPRIRTVRRGKVRRFPRGALWYPTYYGRQEHHALPCVVMVHDMIHERFPELYRGPRQDEIRAFKKRHIRGASALICVSENTLRDVEYFYGLKRQKVFVIPHGISRDFKKPGGLNGQPGSGGRKPFFLFVGLRTAYKNFDGLLKAFSQWPSRRGVDLVVVGEPWTAREKRLIEEFGVVHEVRLLVNLDDSQLARLYNQAQAFVHPSLYEGFGIPLLEAMACGCPIVASRIPTTTEVAGECPVYFEPDQTDDIVRALDEVLRTERSSERIAIGLERSKAFSWDKAASQTLSVFDEVL